MIVAAHQPHYMPWLGYLDKLAQGPMWLTVPLARGSQSDLILDKKIVACENAKQHWQHRHWHTIETNYRRAPFFDRYAEELHEVYTREWSHLLELDLHMLSLARKWLDIDTPVIRSSTLGLVGAKTDRLIDMCKKLGARCYLTGAGGSSSYLDSEKMGRSGIGVIWQDFQHPVYPQRHGAFASHLGFLDLLLNVGPDSRDFLFGQSHPLRVHSPGSAPHVMEAAA